MNHVDATPTPHPGQSVVDVLILGSGVAGLAAATQAALRHNMSVTVVTKASIDMSTTRWAQGGVAVELDNDPDGIAEHIADTLAAGAGLCDEDAVTTLVTNGPHVVQQLIDLGAQFDASLDGSLALATEGGHSRPRVIHAGGAATGAEIERALVAATLNAPITVLDHSFATELIMEDGACVGAHVLTSDGMIAVRARHTVIATGGAGQLYAVTTNPALATGDGLALAVRAGATIADMEFIQFHPTALHHDNSPRSLITEALRGHGAVLRNQAGERFVDELLPRDVVSRAIVATMQADKADHVWLDATQLDRLDDEFPTICVSLKAAGYDPASEWVPVAPAAHHQCGGVAVDIDGATTVPHLWAIGEVSCTGSHGANRLASNSLLEGLVFGARAINAIAAGKAHAAPTGVLQGILEPAPSPDNRTELQRANQIGVETLTIPRNKAHDSSPAPTASFETQRLELQELMFTNVGLIRTHESISHAIDYLESHQRPTEYLPAERITPEAIELDNLLTVGRLVAYAARHRTESRGTHSRSDHPETNPHWQRRIVVVEES